MENNTIKTIPYKGKTIEVYQDLDCQSPEEWGDDNLFLVNYHRDFEVRRDEIITEDDVRSWYQGEKIEQSKQYHIFQLSMLSHSGVWLSLNSSFACDAGGWDTSRVGVVLVSKKEAKTKEKAVKLADGLIESWNDCLSGNVYGYIITGIEDSKTLDSCWGFYGDYDKSGMIEEAKSIIDEAVEQERLKHLRKLKAMIKNKAPLNKREPAKI